MTPEQAVAEFNQCIEWQTCNCHYAGEVLVAEVRRLQAELEQAHEAGAALLLARITSEVVRCGDCGYQRGGGQ